MKETRRLWLVRHAIAADRADPAEDDAQRALTPGGRKRFARAARGLRIAGLAPDLLVSSPLVRAVQTAKILASAYPDLPPVLLCDALAPGGSTEGVLDFLKKAARWSEAVLVGHRPDLGRLLADLAGSPGGLQVDFRKGGAALVELPASARKGTLRLLLSPRILRRLRPPKAR